MIRCVDCKQVEDEIKRAVATMKALPPVKVQGYFSLLSRIIPAEVTSADADDPIRFHPLPSDITRMDWVIEHWLVLLDCDTRKLVWSRCAGMGWKRLSRMYGGASKVTLWRRYRDALELILSKQAKI